LVFHPGPRALAQLFLFPLKEPVLVLNLHAVRDPQWGFEQEPALKVVWRFSAPVKAVRFATVKSFAPAGEGTVTAGVGATVARPGESVRVEVDFEGAAMLALEGDGFSLGPIVVAPAVTPSPPPFTPRWGGGGSVPMA
jgi:hypothetical protein